MNEIQRQVYLSALGVETYMPRWQLPAALESSSCKLDMILAAENHFDVSVIVDSTTQKTFAVNDHPLLLNALMDDVGNLRKSLNSSNQSAMLSNVVESEPVSRVQIAPFSLSVWRPFAGMMVVDERNTKLALPVAVLLQNILREIFKDKQIYLKEEVLRWPMIENNFIKCTQADVNLELQTWLSVQNEIQPIKYLWIMGYKIAQYFLAENKSDSAHLFNVSLVGENSVKALFLPSLNEILQEPLQKRKLLGAVNLYHASIS
jgi:hypothetical protein